MIPDAMPIEVETLEAANRPLDERVLEFLQRDPRKAFAVLEIYAAVQGFDEATVALVLLTASSQDRLRAIQPFYDALERLEEKGLVRSGSAKGDRWYHAVT